MNNAMTLEYVKIKRWYLEMKTAPAVKQNEPAPGVSVKKFGKLSCDEYRYINKIAGEGVMWVDRQVMSDEKLSAIIHSPDTEMFGLYYHNELAGFAEISKQMNEYELHYFGLLKSFRGKGLANYFFQWVIQYVWNHNPNLFRLNTCEYDSTHALKFYQKNGMELVEERIEEQALIRKNGNSQ